jgi:nitrite reductase/ring-hydroxylating ferredoxin subunit/uncharacterized membrane protein
MRSTAQFKSHPLHPILIPFPIAFLTGGTVADFVGRFGDLPGWWTAASYLLIAGVITALVAAVPGIIDYLYTVPPDSSGKKRATKHAIVNVSSVVLFVIAVALKGWPPSRPGVASLILELAGLGLLMFGGWLGGTLVHRNFIGVEHRYADAGKWSETTVARRDAQKPEGAVVAKSDELKRDQMKLIRLDDGTRVALARNDDGYCAFQDRCTHRGGSLADGVLICGTVQCLWHGSQFDTKSGQVRSGPAKEPIKTYHVEERDGEVRLLVTSQGNRE